LPKLPRPERLLFAHLVDVILPPGANDRLPLGATDAGVVEFFEQHLAYLPLRTRIGLRAGVAVLGAAARLHPRGACRALDRLADSRLYAVRELVVLLKSVVCLGYFTHPDVRRTVGLDLPLEPQP
jgi:hypothetical protein